MTTKNYLLLSAGVTLVWVLGLLLIPPFANAVENLMLLFLLNSA